MNAKSNMDDVITFINNPINVAQMIIATEDGKPALTPIIESLEEIFDDNSDFPLSNNRNRVTVGILVKQVMKEYGYELYKKRVRISRKIKAKYFRTSSIYKRCYDKPKHTMLIETTITVDGRQVKRKVLGNSKAEVNGYI